MDSNIFFLKKKDCGKDIWIHPAEISTIKEAKKNTFRLLSYTFLAFANMFMLNLQSQKHIYY